MKPPDPVTITESANVGTYEQGRKDMLAECIAVVAQSFAKRIEEWEPVPGHHQFDIICQDEVFVSGVLRALQEKP